jgi:hypothetical protein
MIKFGKGVVKHRVLILIVAFALLIPSGISFINTRINFDSELEYYYRPFTCKVAPLSLCALYMGSSHMVLHASLYIHAL